MRLPVASLLALVALILCACGGGESSPMATSAQREDGGSGGSAQAAAVSGAVLRDWPEFGLDPQRTNATNRPTGITVADLRRMRLRRVRLPGTVDSSPIYLHDAQVGGRPHDTVVVTTTYGRTIAIDADDGTLLWTFTPSGYGGVADGHQVTNASPIADPDRRWVYAASPDGLIHKLSLATGHEPGGGAWPVRITLGPLREKLGAALNIAGPDVLASTGGYNGDAPPYQGHVVAISRADGSVRAVFNTLCADRRTIFAPPSCPDSDSAILSRGGPVVEPGGRRLLISTGNASWNGTTAFGDSVIELTYPELRFVQAFTPTDQERLNTEDLDLGSSAPALLSPDRILVAGKDTTMRVLDLHRLDGHPPGGRQTLGGEVQTFPAPGNGRLFTQPAVWRHDGRTIVFAGLYEGTAAYELRGGRLQPLWENRLPGTSPIVAGGLLYVYDPTAGGIVVYSPVSGRPLAKLPGERGHWNSPIVVDGHVIEPVGSANTHDLTGELEILTAP